MNINFNSFSYYALSFKNMVNALSPAQKKILSIVSIAFAFLTAAYVVRRYGFCSQVKLLNGPGNITDSNGTTYVGIFKNGQLVQGKKTYLNGITFEGIFTDTGLNGHGKIIAPKGIIAPEGIIAIGEFKDYHLYGQGEITYSNGMKIKGTFKDTGLNGQGKITYSSGSAEGEFKDHALNGKGKLTTLHGATYEGIFQNNELNGQGKITYSSGSVNNGSVDDTAKATAVNIEEGEFKDNMLNGQGKRIYSNGKVEEGIFEKGILIHPKT